MAPLEIEQIPVLRDNFIYLARDSATGTVAVIDPAEAAPVLDRARLLGWHITYILNTHHHSDHISGNLEIKAATSCTIIGSSYDPERIPGIDVRVKDGDTVDVGASKAKVFFVPGHTRGHIAYWFADSSVLFCGDTIFSIGCGRMFEGTPEQMWNSMSRLRDLPPETRIYCAHEYTESNLRFAVNIDPNNVALIAREAEVKALRGDGKYSVPSLMGTERAANPFLRADAPELAAAVNMTGRSVTDVFAEIRRRKDVF